MFESLPLVQTGATGILVVVVFMVLRGKLIPKSTADQHLAETNRQLEQAKQDRDMWKAAYFNETAANRQLTGQVSELMEVGRTAGHLIRSLPTLDEVEGSSDETVSSA